jgi:predicted nuclease of predicted toxin-antitoxin system
MKFKIDENLPDEVARRLEAAGHDAHTVADEGLRGSVDDELSMVLKREQRVIITLDRGFSNIHAYPPPEFSGLIVLRLRNQDRNLVVDTIERLIPEFTRRDLTGTLWIVDETRIRIRS